MLARQTRRSILLQHTSSLAPIGRQLRCLPPQPATSKLTRRCIVTQHFQPRKRQGSEPNHGLAHGRRLATAVNDFKFSSSYSPLDNSTLPDIGSRFENPFLSTGPLLIPESGPRPSGAKTSIGGIPGDPEDMISVFDACVRVGKLDRAALVLKRINLFGVVPGEERILLHNQYLRALLHQIRTGPDRKQAESLHNWYELEIRNRQIPLTAETIAYMLKASLLSDRGAGLERHIERYMSMAPGETGLRVLSMADILSDSDLAIITEICPTYNFVPEAEAEQEQYDMEEPRQVELMSDAKYPDILPTPQRGIGLEYLRSSLSLMAELETVDISRLSREEQVAFQIRLERDTVDIAIEKWKRASENLQNVGVNTLVASTNSKHTFLPEWLKATEQRIRLEFTKIEESENRASKTEEDLERCLYGPLIRQSDPTRLAAVTILSVMNSSVLKGADRGVPLTKLISDVSRNVQEDLRIQLSDKEKLLHRRSRKVQYTGNDADMKVDKDCMILDGMGPDVKPPAATFQKPWSPTIRAHVGAILVKSMVETAKIKVVKSLPTGQLVSQNQPAFSHMSQPRRGKKVGMLILNTELIDRIKKEPVGDFLAKHLPMVAEPKPWQTMNEGGFHWSKTQLIRVKPGDVEQRLYAKAAIRRGDMKQVYQGLDVLGKTAWTVNKKVLDVMVESWNTGKAFANFPPLDPELVAPPEPTNSDDPLVKKAWHTAVKAVENERSGLHSQRCFMNLQLKIARAFRNQTIYFPHNVDYRGRAYPMPTYLNHMGADHSRAILRFAKGKVLGANGLRWLKIHLANLYGFDKASFAEREAFADDNLANIQDAATHPLTGSQWWLKAEDPWQCLAACFELAAAHELPDPTEFVSQLPVHQDGTCNGLQHYAALGGDSWGAQQVNLMPGSRPADVYSAVANQVKESIAKEAAAKNIFALAVDGKITRKVVKQTVMTNVYGVTFRGALRQVNKQIDALYPNLHKESGISHTQISSYIAKHIFTALASMFRGAHDIQYWLGEIGGRVCRALTPAQLEQIADEYKSERDSLNTKEGKRTKKPKVGMDELTDQFRSTVVWTSPLRMPVAQPYRKSSMKEIHTCLQTITYAVGSQLDPVNRRKQLQGFPPNFIHSLDASHMLLSAIECGARGLEFAAVHDSFWTHASDLDTMNSVLRESFIKIHQEDVVGRLAVEFEARYKGALYLASIDASTPVAKKIKDLRASSNLTPKEELLLEYKRQTLKSSGNPWDLEAAEKIVTPASVYEEMSANEEDVEVRDALGEVGLGSVMEGSEEIDVEIAGSTQKELGEDDPEDFATQNSSAQNGEMLEVLRRNSFEQEVLKTSQPKSKPSAKRPPLQLWLPLVFPAVPAKGDFDVSQLRESKYFFS
ncbi:DNA-directed RNA polymerase [Thelonectria olida]|uniref:DNA-directed RNA polymerase n=1 Tax=Thelonectria olida TaxID=1576542 RepID=A0A9P8WA90_9HYPO|nr:DNA-directed RNA polymerase [Thelonectria olida]